MQYRKFRADELFDGYTLRKTDDTLIADATGKVIEIAAAADAGEDVETYSGILSPGLINCHCHLELSHLKNIIPPHTGLVDFLCSVVSKRGFEQELIQEEIRKAEQEMFENGIVAVGDIGNTADTVVVKQSSKLRWHNFVEVLGFSDEKAASNLQHYTSVADELKTHHRTTLTPHAPYSISPLTFQLINTATTGKIISVHNQETAAEDELYKTGSGDFLRFYKIFGLDRSPFPVTGKCSIRSYLPYFNNGQTILLIHNTFMCEEDIVWANEYAAANGLTLVYCFCINANLYIENKVPAVALFQQQHCNIVLGTDSYSSNWQLSVTKEIQALLQHSSIAAEQALQMATLNGAKALQWQNDLGSFEKNKQPGIVLLEKDFSSSKRLL
ncbi:amidohydrolase [Lacibacter luteus]|uniref:Amidohydrolase n=1 Tax=Lacibacter luteus TaxID=2508719 RepID=A0A4Q1CHV2_9BACT|nr:amidohydrolase family protein [Lacibacter luteus]RXK59860.1 amidohydrolase [Lacibacter luteus]